MSIRILSQIPNLDTSRLITTNHLSLVRVDDHVVDSTPMTVISLHIRRTKIPDFDSPVLAGCGHPLGLNVEGNTRDIGRVAIEGEDGIWVLGETVVETDVLISCCCQEMFVR